MLGVLIADPREQVTETVDHLMELNVVPRLSTPAAPDRSGIHPAPAEDCALNGEHVLQEIHNTSPLSVVMAEKLQALRSWASERAVSAD